MGWFRMPATGTAVAAGVAILFGVATILSGGRALFGGADARAAVGDAVPFVLWFNFLAGFLYVADGVGLLARRPWATGLAVAILAATAAVFAAFAIHVALGGAYESRTVWAMALRTAVWAGIALTAWRAGPRPGERGRAQATDRT